MKLVFFLCFIISGYTFGQNDSIVFTADEFIEAIEFHYEEIVKLSPENHGNIYFSKENLYAEYSEAMRKPFLSEILYKHQTIKVFNVDQLFMDGANSFIKLFMKRKGQTLEVVAQKVWLIKGTDKHEQMFVLVFKNEASNVEFRISD